MSFKVNDKVRVLSDWAESADVRKGDTGVITEVYSYGSIKVLMDEPRSTLAPDWLFNSNSLELIKENEVSNTVSATDLRQRALSYPYGGAAYNALIELADKIDPPKPRVSVRHSAVVSSDVIVEFENAGDASAISHFLYIASDKIERVYQNDPHKQDVVRAFVDAWHNRSH